MAAEGIITVLANVTNTGTNGLGTYSGNPQISTVTSFSTSDISKVYTAAGTTAVNLNLDVTSGLTDAFGNALVFGTVKTFVLKNTHATATLTVGGGTNPLFGSDQYTVAAGACLPITTSFTVDSTHKVIRVVPSASCTYQLMILGS